MADPNVSACEGTPVCDARYTLLGGAENIKLLFDEELDDRREHRANERAWEALKLRKANNSESFDHFVSMAAAQATASAEQTGQTENEQTVSPIRTGTGDAIVGTVGVSADAIAASMGNLATSLVPVIASSLATAISTAIAALLPVVVTAAGGASTPSQTQAKPTTATA